MAPYPPTCPLDSCRKPPRWSLHVGALAAVVALLQALAPVPALAQPLPEVARSLGVDIPARRGSFTPGEFALLPEYCQYQQNSPLRATPRGRYWMASLGPTLEHIHHYCRGLRDMHFARTVLLSPQHRHFLWNRAAGEIEYMFNTNPPETPLMPEWLFRYGEVMIELGRLGDAKAAFERSRQLKPDYWPAYTGWADFLIRNRQFDEARALIEEGLRNIPDAPQLVQRRDRIANAR
jgi:tetratricopeptide (TPR) repeat protein